MATAFPKSSIVQFQPRNGRDNLLPARDAFPLTIPGFAGIEFRLYKIDTLWAISELITGLIIVRGMDSKNHAVDQATYRLTSKGVKATLEAIKYNIDRLKISSSVSSIEVANS